MKTYLWHIPYCSYYVQKQKGSEREKKLIIGCFDCISVSLPKVPTSNEKVHFVVNSRGPRQRKKHGLEKYADIFMERDFSFFFNVYVSMHLNNLVCHSN